MQSADVQRIPMAQIQEPGHQLRESIDAESLGALADSIAANGLLQPLGVRGPHADNRWEIIWGHRRFLACRLLRWETVPAYTFPPDYDPLDAAAAENMSRADLTPLEEARLVGRYIERGEANASIARVLRRSTAWVALRREILAWPAELQAAIHAGELGVGVARALADVDHAEYRASLLAEATRTGATERVVEVWKAHYLADRDRIVGNYFTVEEIASRREAWKLKIACELCGDELDYDRTRQVRACEPCWAAIGALMQEAAAGSRPNGTEQV